MKGHLNHANDMHALALKIAEALIPLEFENDRQWLSKLLQSSPKVSPEFSKKLVFEKKATEISARL